GIRRTTRHEQAEDADEQDCETHGFLLGDGTPPQGSRRSLRGGAGKLGNWDVRILKRPAAGFLSGFRISLLQRGQPGVAEVLLALLLRPAALVEEALGQ